MKKVTKATIAAAAAGVLLLGGAGTIAKWSDTKDIDAGTVTTGHLTLDTTVAGTWTDTSSDAATTAFDPATDHLVPGDTVVFNQTAKIEAVGKNLKGKLTADDLIASIPSELNNQVNISVVAEPTDPKLTANGNVVSFSEPGSYEVPVKVTIDFVGGTPGATPETTMNKAIDLTGWSLTLDQVRP